ncbi:MAG: ABC transporter permease [Lachnospiraceae bacterium]|nr:ABC transporter permease [Lachnospiraceae bacterium]
MQKKLYDQQMAERWSKQGDVAQVSVFFSKEEVENIDYFRTIRQSVHNALQQASITVEKENARLWIDAMSRSGKVTLRSERATMEVKAIGVGGEFFQFHPQKILSGSLFREDSMMQDGVVIDKETAWQLFGSSDVTGMQIMIGQVPHFITGVIERPKGHMYEAAGLEKPICFLSLESLENYGIATGGFSYEIVMPNPIRNFALSTIQAAVGTKNENVVLIENSSRFQVLSLYKVIKQFGIRSMSFQEISYPYWENVARGYEDIFAVFLGIKIILLINPVIFVLAVIISWWKKKTWTLKQGIVWVQDSLYEKSVKRVQKKNDVAKK